MIGILRKLLAVGQTLGNETVWMHVLLCLLRGQDLREYCLILIENLSGCQLWSLQNCALFRRPLCVRDSAWSDGERWRVWWGRCGCGAQMFAEELCLGWGQSCGG